MKSMPVSEATRADTYPPTFYRSTDQPSGQYFTYRDAADTVWYISWDKVPVIVWIAKDIEDLGLMSTWLQGHCYQQRETDWANRTRRYERPVFDRRMD